MALSSLRLGDYETCWEQTILAHQARRGIQDSHYFGLVPRPDMARQISYLESWLEEQR